MQEEKKAAKEAEWRAIQEKARLRRDPQAFAKYEEEVLARRLEQHKKRKEEEAFHLGANDIVIGSEEESTTPSPKVKLDGLPDGWKSAVDATTGNTYYVRSSPCHDDHLHPPIRALMHCNKSAPVLCAVQ